MTPPRRAKLVLLGLVIAVLALSLGFVVREWEHIWHWWTRTGLMAERTLVEYTHPTTRITVRGWSKTPRIGGMKKWLESVRFYLNGFKHEELFTGPGVTRRTWWNPDGSVRHQSWHRLGESTEEQREKPPWWWGVKDQTAPSMPAWMKDDAKWQAALDAQE